MPAHLNHQPDEFNRRQMQRVRIDDTKIELDVMIYGDEPGARRPLLILNSIDFPIPPSVDFCERMWSAGYQVIFCRRPGYGPRSSLPHELLEAAPVKGRAPLVTEAALITMMIKSMRFKNITLLGLGTANPICLRLAHLCPDIEFTVFSNPLFHPSIWNVIRPGWLRRMIRQTLASRSGLKIAVKGLRAVLRRDPLWFYRQFAQKSAGDVRYVENNPEDFRESAIMLKQLDERMFYYDLQTALIEDARWKPALTRDLNAVILSGEETTPAWKKTIIEEAKRLALPIVFADEGDLFVPYVSPDVLLKVLGKQVSAAH